MHSTNHKPEDKRADLSPEPHSHSHSHSHSVFHSHAGDESHGADSLVSILQGKGDRGSHITLVGLASNVGLTVCKGVAGWMLHSASLLADAGHSASDLVGDFVVLFCWKFSRRPPTSSMPFGFGKFETLGTSTVALILIAGALGIGFHSYGLLLHSLSDAAATMPAGHFQTVLHNVTEVAPTLPASLAAHDHSIVDPQAAWFALLSILVKEALYRVTKRVAEEEHSPVLLASAIHHRSDAYSSLVALFAILGSWIFPTIPLDPLGGLLVSVVILYQGSSLFASAWSDLTDAGITKRKQDSLRQLLRPLHDTTYASPAQYLDGHLLDIADIRGRRAGSLLFIDVTAVVPSNKLKLDDALNVEDKIRELLKGEKKEIAEVSVRFKTRANETS